MPENLKEKTIAGMLWSSVGRLGTMLINFLSNLVLARLLMPDDFGCIAMLYVFIAVSAIFVNGGLGTALIQRKNPTHLDYTTVFYWNLAVSLIFYLLLFFTAPAIARFYAMPQLSAVLRVQSLTLLIQAFAIVQATQLQKQLRFRELSIRNLIAAIIGTVIGIAMAFWGYGVWSLVASSLCSAVASVLLLWRMSSWRPTWEFSWKSLGSLFSFGGLMLLSSLVETIYVNIQRLIIGKMFTASDLGYYNQAKKLEEVPTTTLSTIVNEVSFPVFSKLQDDRQQLHRALRKNIKAVTYLNFPLMMLLIVIAHPIITLLYSSKWESSVPYFQILCLYGFLYTLNTLNTNIIKSLGKGALFFFLQLSKRLIGIGMIVVGVKWWGIMGMMWSIAIFGLVCYIINTIAVGKLVRYGLFRQFMDWLPCLLVTAVSVVVAWLCGHFWHLHEYGMMLIQICLFSITYLSVSYMFKLEAFNIYLEIVKSKWNRFRNRSNQ